MHLLFIRLHYFIERNKLVFYSGLVAFLIACFYAITTIKFDEDITRILPQNEQSSVTAKVFKQLNFNDKVTVLIERKSGSIEETIELAQQLRDTLLAQSNYVKSIEGIIPDEQLMETLDFASKFTPYFLTKADYDSLKQKINSTDVSDLVQNHYEQLWNPTSMVTKQFMFSDPYGMTFTAVKKFQRLNVSDDFQLIDGFLFTKDSSQLLFFIQPVFGGSETENNMHFVNFLNELQQDINVKHIDQAELSFFGSSMVAVANAKQIKKDIWTTVAISTTILMILLMFFYRRIWIPFILFIPTVVAGIIGLASLALLKDAISAISLSIAGILVGITIDYALHILTHYKKNSDIEKLYKDITTPLLMSSTTTAAAFVCLIFVKSNALKDLGLFAALCVLLSALFSLILIPQIYKPKKELEIAKSNWIERFAAWDFEKSKGLITLSITLIIASLFTYKLVGFDNDLSKLNFFPEELKQVERKLEEKTSLSDKTIYLVNYGNSLDEAIGSSLLLARKLESQKSVDKIKNFTDISSILLSSEEKQNRINEWTQLWSNQRIDSLRNTFAISSQAVGIKSNAYDSFFDKLKNIPEISLDDLKELQSIPLQDFVSEKDGFYTVSTIVKVDHGKTADFVNSLSGLKNLVVIDRQEMNEQFLGQLKDDFNRLVNYSSIAVLVILFVFFRRIELVAIAFIPIALTAFVTAGIMGMLQIEFNIFSLIVCTLVFGHGVDFSIFMTSALQKKQSTGEDDLRLFRTSILLAVLTTILAIGALIFAKHPALVSISSISLVGVTVAVLITFVFYPLIFNYLIQKRTDKGKAHPTWLVFLNSLISFFYYGLGSVVLTLIAAIYIYVLPGNKSKKKYHFQILMSKFFFTVIRSVPFSKMEVRNWKDKYFESPSIIIANHASFLDTLCVGMLHPKVKFVVNDWVYSSPIFGWAVRILGFYPASKGIDGSVEHLRPLIDEGYSIVVFPEGTRSYTNEIQRFHKGAFYLSTYFNLPILPVYLHGQSDMLPKGDFMIYHERITVVIGDRIDRVELEGKSLRDQSKLVSAEFKRNFRELRNELEGPTYFKNKILSGNLYKEQDIRLLAKSDFESYQEEYHQLIRFIPESCSVLVVDEQIGNLSYLLSLDSPKRKVSSYYSNHEQQAIAASHYLSNKFKIRFEINLSEVIAKVSCVIVLKNNNLIDLNLFDVVFETNSWYVLNLKDETAN